jgi:hypothetical protein
MLNYDILPPSQITRVFDWNANIKESMRNLLKHPTKIYYEFEQTF